MNVSNIESVESNIRKEKPDYFIHSGALTRPMSLHNDYPSLSIKSNIIGTANVVMVCQKYNVKGINEPLVNYHYQHNKQQVSMNNINFKKACIMLKRKYPKKKLLKFGLWKLKIKRRVKDLYE